MSGDTRAGVSVSRVLGVKCTLPCLVWKHSIVLGVKSTPLCSA
jgi:hypothetical protein